ncbi:hypothetical protein PX52LOC_04373 [Limnoglobus roseus]|uniref:Uncharacterized protein n=1 Tax=Limnoglobus roseus TaxID=2598579 RepID=A0A5C1AHB5_9BACT|nr:hypothetical protein PX52LOC_04373 [Limnoglobus roseus]
MKASGNNESASRVESTNATGCQQRFSCLDNCPPAFGAVPGHWVKRFSAPDASKTAPQTRPERPATMAGHDRHIDFATAANLTRITRQPQPPDPGQDCREQIPWYCHLGQLVDDVLGMADHLGPDLDEFLPERRQRPAPDRRRQHQPPEEVGQVVGQGEHLQPGGVGGARSDLVRQEGRAGLLAPDQLRLQGEPAGPVGQPEEARVYHQARDGGRPRQFRRRIAVVAGRENGGRSATIDRSPGTAGAVRAAGQETPAETVPDDETPTSCAETRDRTTTCRLTTRHSGQVLMRFFPRGLPFRVPAIGRPGLQGSPTCRTPSSCSPLGPTAGLRHTLHCSVQCCGLQIL